MIDFSSRGPWEPHPYGCGCPQCKAHQVFISDSLPADRDPWANDPDRTTRRESFQ